MYIFHQVLNTEYLMIGYIIQHRAASLVTGNFVIFSHNYIVTELYHEG